METLTLNKNTVFLVTGVAGFIGSNLAEKCLNLGFKVIGIDNFSNGNKTNIEILMKNSNFKFVYGDISNYETCCRVCKNVDFVFHEAAWGSVPRSILEPLNYTKNNIVGTHNMLHAAYVNQVKGFIYASSSSVYGNNNDNLKSVGREGVPLSPYALSKKENEEMALLYYNLYGLKTIGLRYFNVFGKNQNPNSEYSAVIPKFIKCILQNKSITINGDGNQSRDFTYVDNVVEANLKACININKCAGEVFNVGCGFSTSINELYNLICKNLKMKVATEYVDERKGDIKHSLADISKTQEKLDYDPKYDIKEGLIKTIEWYKQNL